MKTTISPPPPPQPPPTFTIELTEAEFNDLLAVCDWNSSVAQFLESKNRAEHLNGAFRNKLALKQAPTRSSVERTLMGLWSTVPSRESRE